MRTAFVLSLLLASSGCYAGLTGRVVDAETRRPIEGAVVLVEWSKTRGIPGMVTTKVYRVEEQITDVEGRVTLSGEFDPFVDPPEVTIYRMGYVAWNSERIFPTRKNRTDFKWQRNYTFRLEKFKTGYKHYDHIGFIDSAIHPRAKLTFRNVYEWEEMRSIQELRKMNEEKGRLPKR